MARTRLYRSGVLALEGFPVGDVSRYLAEPNAVVWLDLCQPEPADFAAVGEELGLHELALEDAVHAGQRPKLDSYRSHQFLSAYAVSVAPDDVSLVTREIAVLITANALITVRKDAGLPIDEVVARWDRAPATSAPGVGLLLYGLLDYLVDGHFAAVQHFDDRIEELDELLFREERRQIQEVQQRSYQLRKSLVRLRRVVLPMREVVNSLMRPDLGVVPEPLMPYYRDVYDHVLRVTEWTESLRDVLTSLVETNLSVQANRMNMIMKKVTSWAAIIAVPTAITGFYGQNLPYPGFGQRWGFLVSTLVIVALSVLLYVAFRRKDWL
ncbi:magnesium transporter CorA family protein [Streptacidiphilus jiangxiensis]|uniref:Magnesium transporter n=1 Tax=Streptacidiphilus jiangxiensis TaxID=235985 RepID=A0A1H7ZVB5_STRJI|nr:magnesium transporter CorA family protein [Streptacidiphilus jiangxiensis]SEM62261.1 magnesium transporter [Streptacidiphilus jiangxiensis]